MSKPPLGILTYGFGKPRYVEMAKMLARSLDFHGDKTPRAVVTDSDDPDLARLFNLIVPFNAGHGVGVRQKLFLDAYSPYERTLFIDSDCLVVGRTDWLWDHVGLADFLAVGQPLPTAPHWFDRNRLPPPFQFETYPVFNGGLYYFTKTPAARKVFEDARWVADNYVPWGLVPFRGGINEEPAYALAMALNGIPVLVDAAWPRQAMRTPIGLIGPLKMDVLKGVCRFNKHGVPVAPVIVHFCGEFAEQSTYRRECLKLRLAGSKGWGNGGVSAFADTAFFLSDVAGGGMRRLRRLAGKLKRVLIARPVQDAAHADGGT